MKEGPVAIKRIFNAFSTNVDAKRTYREIMYLSYFSDHPNIVTLRDVIAGDNDMDLYVVVDYMETDLSSIIQTSNIQPIHSQYITWQLLCAVKFLHSANVVHRDIKPSNILLNSQCVVKLCDFGMARSVHYQYIDKCGPLPEEDFALSGKTTKFKTRDALLSDEEVHLTQYCSSRWYRSPEQLVDATNYNTSIDMWALGCVIAEIALRRPVFPGTCTLGQLTLILHLTGRPIDTDLSSIKSVYVVQILEGLGKSKQGSISEILPGVSSIEMKDLVQLLLQFNPDKRLTPSEALEHPYVGHFHSPDAEMAHALTEITLPLSDDVQYHVSAYRDRIYADVLGLPDSISRVNKDRRIKMELAGETEANRRWTPKRVIGHI